MEILELHFLYARVRLDSQGARIEALRTAGPNHGREEIKQSLNHWFREDPQQWPEELIWHPGGQDVSVFPIRMGLEGELGLIVAGSQRAGFPEQTEKLILSVAANQAAIGLQQALRLHEQKQVATELDRRVADRTRELAETNEDLQLQVGLLQHLPVSAWTLKPDGTPDFVNQVWLEFSGQTLDFIRSHPEAWMTAVHPDDRETASRVFWAGVRSGQGFAMETRALLNSLPHSHALIAYSEPKNSDRKGKDYDISGRLSLSSLQQIQMPKEADFYLCEPAAFLRDLTADLKSWGVPGSSIHSEIFGAHSSITPGIASSTSVSPHPPDKNLGAGPKVSFTRSGLTVPWDSRYGSILEFAEACDVPVRWSCRTGVCHMCESGLIDGKVSYAPEPLDRPAEGNILICCSSPLTEIELDL